MNQRDPLVHLFAGGCGGTVGAILTCPLEVVKTRLQSSSVTLYIPEVHLNTINGARVSRVARVSPGPLHCLKMILEKEGPRSLFRGLGPNLVGVAPSRAIYFAAYSSSKEKLNTVLEPDSSQVHMVSAGVAVTVDSLCYEDLPSVWMAIVPFNLTGFTAITATNPIWLIKTRLQLEARGERRMSAFECVRRVYRSDGIRGFYRGMSASYAGISETVIHFVIYEGIKQKLVQSKASSNMDPEEDSVKYASDFIALMLAAATSKTCATSIAYPHGLPSSVEQTLQLVTPQMLMVARCYSLIQDLPKCFIDIYGKWLQQRRLHKIYFKGTCITLYNLNTLGFSNNILCKCI
uniref:solute carrier family 25 member 36-A isoform X2 n=1 Tax=Pristiophorus japonicus TaxID=55135 RepID=UPI00398F2AEA